MAHHFYACGSSHRYYTRSHSLRRRIADRIERMKEIKADYEREVQMDAKLTRPEKKEKEAGVFRRGLAKVKGWLGIR